MLWNGLINKITLLEVGHWKQGEAGDFGGEERGKRKKVERQRQAWRRGLGAAIPSPALTVLVPPAGTRSHSLPRRCFSTSLVPAWCCPLTFMSSHEFTTS